MCSSPLSAAAVNSYPSTGFFFIWDTAGRPLGRIDQPVAALCAGVRGARFLEGADPRPPPVYRGREGGKPGDPRVRARERAALLNVDAPPQSEQPRTPS